MNLIKNSLGDKKRRKRGGLSVREKKKGGQIKEFSGKGQKKLEPKVKNFL